MHYPLRQFFTRGAFAQRLDHVVHEVDHELPLLRQLLLFQNLVNLT